MRFTDKVALITGAGSGIGAATALELAAGGASVVATDIDLDAAQRVADTIVADGGRAVAFRQDASRAADSDAAVAFAVETFGALHLAVNNAGITGGTERIGETDPTAWDRVIALNLSGVFYGMRYQLPAMQASGSGSIVNVASIHGTVATPFGGASAYTAAKHGVVGLTKNAAIEYGRDGIRVNAVGPGYIATPLLSRLDEEATRAIATRHPLDRLGTAEEVAHLIAFLLSDEASFITGSYELVDGGYTAV